MNNGGLRRRVCYIRRCRPQPLLRKSLYLIFDRAAAAARGNNVADLNMAIGMPVIVGVCVVGKDNGKRHLASRRRRGEHNTHRIQCMSAVSSANRSQECEQILMAARASSVEFAATAYTMWVSFLSPAALSVLTLVLAGWLWQE